MASTQTVLHPIGTLFLIIMSIALFSVPRKFAIVPIFAVAFFLTMNLRIVIAGLDFTMLRILFTIAWIRVIKRSEIRLIRLNPIDKILIVFVIVRIVTYVILWKTTGALINRLGGSFDIISMYFIIRILVRDFNDVERLCKILLLMSIPIATVMIFEQITGHNFFTFLGGVSPLSEIRDGKIRSQGSFAHSILAGNFGAFLLPLVMGLWWKKRINKMYFIVGIISASTIVITSASSGPFVAYLAGIIGLCLWPLHKYIRIVFWGGVLALISLHFVMKAPVWALVMRLGSGGSSYHRFNLIDQTIRHFNEWWLIGIQNTSHWGYLMADIANYYCRICVDSGLIGLVLFLTIIGMCFISVDNAIKKINKRPHIQKFIWALGSALLVHTMAFIGISYIGSNLFMFYVTCAILSSITIVKIRHIPTFNIKKAIPMKPQN